MRSLASPARGALLAAAVAVGLLGAATVASPTARADGEHPQQMQAQLTAPPASKPVVVPLDPVTYDSGVIRPELAERVAKVQAAAKKEKLNVTVTSGYRSTAEQAKLFKSAIGQYGSAAEASKWVLPPWASHHVQGIAVDLGPDDATRAWIEKRQDDFGLCRRYANETWHFELNVWGTCPPIIPSAADEL